MSARILVVDDNPLNLRMLADWLASEHYVVSTAADGFEALEKITAAVMWINSADDFINPPELGIAEKESKRLKNGTFVLLPISEQTHGHGTHTWAVAWEQYLMRLLEKTAH